ncbi:hypothetical protein CVT26_012105 [Gymnopilus dilepis]|uniref:N-acetyltransferase domain-containing protein n=1 Tax=Gymnopilus dilepis TaxID=231916 RepID=A0A409YGR5_9AGAR|nr:hypothetical protein CVT26_012105 [Gymnopilus dilepis]
MPVGFASKEAQPKPGEKLIVTRGLHGQDDNIDLLASYFKEMQKATVETLNPDDLLSFATCAYYFGVISVETSTPPADPEDVGDEDAEGEPEDETEAVSESAYPPSSRAPSPPASSVATNFSIISPSDEEEDLSEDEIYSRYAALPEQEKVLKWREAFLDKLEEDDEPIVPPTRPEDFYEDVPKEEDVGMSDAQALQNTEHYINWPEDTPADHSQMAEDADLPSSQVPLPDLQFYPPIEPDLMDKEFGREYLEPEQYDTPAPQPPVIPTIPEMDAFIYEEALKYRDRLRALRVAEYERKQARRAREQAARPLAPAPVIGNKPIGLIYLWTSQTFNDPLHMGECSLGFYFAPAYRKREYLVEALNKAVAEAFEDQQCHRLQAIVVENEEKLYSLELLTASGFRHEGTRRRAFYSSIAHEWKDVTYFAMLATEWVYDNDNTSSSVRLRTSSLWDEILTRHQRELDELERLQQRTLKRSTSTETIRQRARDAAPSSIFDFSDAETQSMTGTEGSTSSAASGSKRRKLSSDIAGPSEIRSRLPIEVGTGGDGTAPRGLSQNVSSPTRSLSRVSQAAVGSSARRRRTGGLSFSSSSASSNASSSADWVMLDS